MNKLLNEKTCPDCGFMFVGTKRDIKCYSCSNEQERQQYSRSNMLKTIGDIPQHPQVQDALINQLRDLIPVANKLGLCGAADYLERSTRR